MARLPWQKFDPPVTVIEHAIEYIETHSLVLCALRPKSKAPYLFSWNDGSKGLSTAAAAIAELENTERGVGLLHGPSHTGAFDVDHLEYTKLAFAAFGIDYDALMAGFPRIRSRDGKDKIVFRLPAGFDPDNGKSKIKLTWPDPSGECDAKGRRHLITIFELRGGANQDVLPPSIHPDTEKPYEWVKAPWDFPGGIPTMDDTLITIWREWDRFERQFKAACPWATEPEFESPPQPIARQVSPPGADVIGQYNAATPIPALLQQHGYKPKGKGRWLAPNSSTKIPGVVFLDEGRKVYSHHASDPLNNGHAHDAFSVFTTLEHNGDIPSAIKAAALELGLPFSTEIVPMDFSALVKTGLAKQKKAGGVFPKAPIRAADYAFPPELLKVPGLVGDVASYIGASALFPQPVLELGASLAFCGAMMGRKVRTASDLRTNLMAIGVADSASGKEHARKALKRLAVEAQASAYIGAEKLASDVGLFNLLAEHPACLVLADEFGRTLRVAGNDRSPAHLQQLITSMMELSGSANSYIMEKRRAEHGSLGRAPLVIHNPNLCVYATTVPGRLFANITPEEVTDGFLPRWLVFESDTPDPDKRSSCEIVSEIHPGLLASVSSWAQISESSLQAGAPGSAHDITPHPRLVGLDRHAEQLLEERYQGWRKLRADARGTGIDALWGRAYEHALRLALTRAAGCDFEHLEIREADAQWGADLAGFLISRTAAQVSACVSTNEHENQVQKVERFLREQGSATQKELTRKFRWLKGQERKDIMTGLAEAGVIEITVQKTEGPNQTTFSWVG